MHRHRVALTLAVLLSLLIASPVWAQGEIVITQAKATAGNVTPGDTAGFPVTVSLAGAYVLGGNLTVPPGAAGIVVTASNVDIDLNGFRLFGNNTATYGISSSNVENRIHGGVIRSFKFSGIYLRGNAWTIEDMKITRNGGNGIDAIGARYITVNESLIAENASSGAAVGTNGVFRRSTFSENASYGIACTLNCHVEQSTIDSSHVGVATHSGFLIGNTISGNASFGVTDQSGDANTGIANNMFIDNNAGGFKQTNYTVEVHPNACIGKPC